MPVNEIIEYTAAAFGIGCVYLFIVRNIWSWPTGLVQVVLYIAVFWQAKLYADMILHFFYVGLQLYGWRAWAVASRPQHRISEVQDLSVRRLTGQEVAMYLAAVGVMTFSFAWILQTWTDAQSTVADSFVAAASLVAQFLLARRIVENWVIWLAVDTVGVGLFWNRGLVPTAILYALFWVMALIGLLKWLQALKQPPHSKALS